MGGSGVPGGVRERHFALRGAILFAFLLLLAAARAMSEAPLCPPWLVLVALGMTWRLLAGRHIAVHSNGSRLEAAPLATGGPYALGRHPLYLSNLVSSAGLLLFANCLPPRGAALVLAALWIHHDLLARTEERHLAAVHGEAYQGYMQVTPRWVGLPRRADAFSGGEGMGAALRRQGGNLARTAAAALLIWGLSLA
jgi:protein-S-isoprenylcysteine O-methyltransferase Ste14